jgi:hypothetical protein
MGSTTMYYYQVLINLSFKPKRLLPQQQGKTLDFALPLHDCLIEITPLIG